MSDITNQLIRKTRERMEKSVEATNSEFGSIRTGRASPGLLDRIYLDYYGARTPIHQLATINTPEARLLTIQPYDSGALKQIEKGIIESDLGLTPSNDGNIIRIQIPELNEERRKELVKMVRSIAEDGRVAVRNIRRETMHELRQLKTDGETGEDDERRAESELQKLTDGEIAKIDELLKGKEAEILEV